MKILYLCPKKYWNTKMSRGRFHVIKALGRHTGVRLFCSGPGFPDWKDCHNAEKKVGMPSIVFWYKPLEMTGYADVCSPKVITYNETYDHDLTCREIDQSKSDMIIFHHSNDMQPYRKIYDGKKFMCHLPHCAEPAIYKDYGLSKTTDLLLIGAIQDHYPLRKRVRKLFGRMPERYRCEVFEHPGYNHPDAHTDKYAIAFAKAINQAKVAVTCSGKPRSRYCKYVEVPMCGTALAADLPGQDHEELKRFLIEIDMEMTDEQIMEKLIFHIDHEAERNALVRKGLEWAKAYTQDKYADKFVKAVHAFLEQKK